MAEINIDVVFHGIYLYLRKNNFSEDQMSILFMLRPRAQNETSESSIKLC